MEHLSQGCEGCELFTANSFDHDLCTSDTLPESPGAGVEVGDHHGINFKTEKWVESESLMV